MCVCAIRTHSSRDIVEEEFAEHLPVRTRNNVAKRGPRRRLVWVKYRLESDAEAHDEHGQHEHELNQLCQLQHHHHKTTPSRTML